MSILSKRRKISGFDFAITAILVVWGLVILYPFYNSIIVSFVSQKEYTLKPFTLWPEKWEFASYQYVFSNSKVFTGYKNTFIILLFGVPYNIIITFLTAYAISRDWFPGKKIIVYMIVFTMFFNGGMVPLYLLMRQLKLINKLASVILLYGINTFYLIIIRNYFESIPKSLEEAARIDGANDIVILLRIFLPLSMPILATFLLFYSVDRWNEWFFSMLFINDCGKWPLQAALRNIIMSSYVSEFQTGNGSMRTKVFGDSVKMASVVVTMGPIMIVYPFLQKYFTKGLLVGAVKG